VVAEVFYAGGQTDMTKQIDGFCNFAKAPKVENVSENTLWSTLPSSLVIL